MTSHRSRWGHVMWLHDVCKDGNWRPNISIGKVTIGPDRVSKDVKQSSDVWPFFWKLFGILILIFTTSFDILSNNLFWPNNFSFAKHILYWQPYSLTIRKSKIFLVFNSVMIALDMTRQVTLCHECSFAAIKNWNLSISLFLVHHHKKKQNISCSSS